MAVDLTPRQPMKAYGGEGGAYYEWSPADLPMLGVASIGAAKLSLAAGGMSLPSYSDSAKVAYVLQGMILPICYCHLLLSRICCLVSQCHLSEALDTGVCLLLGCFVSTRLKLKRAVYLLCAISSKS
jgi:hypothetical protein